MSDPKRLLEGGGSDDLQKLLSAAQSDVLDDEAAARVQTRVKAALAVGAVGSMERTASMSASTKAVGAALLVIAVGAGTWAWVSRKKPQSSPATAVTSSASAPAVTASVPSLESAPSAYESTAPVADDAGPSVPKSGTAKPPPAQPPTPREGLLLLQARQALNHDPAKALALIHQHEREFPNSQLAPERAKLLQAALAAKKE